MFLGGIIFGKLNFVLMPLSVLLFSGLMALSFLGLSWILQLDSINLGEQMKFEVLNFDKPEIFPGIPLLLLVIIALFWIAIFLSYVVSYYRLTEKEA
jgi:hypothetical protein